MQNHIDYIQIRNMSRLLLDTPDPDRIMLSRKIAGVSQEKMSSMLGFEGRARVCEFEKGKRKMPGALWTAWMLMIEQHPEFQLVQKPLPPMPEQE